MLIKEEETSGGEINPDTLDEVFDEGTFVEVEEEIISFVEGGEDEDEIDIAFAANDEEYW